MSSANPVTNWCDTVDRLIEIQEEPNRTIIRTVFTYCVDFMSDKNSVNQYSTIDDCQSYVRFIEIKTHHSIVNSCPQKCILRSQRQSKIYFKCFRIRRSACCDRHSRTMTMPVETLNVTGFERKCYAKHMQQ